jgi:hypothetical protein
MKKLLFIILITFFTILNTQVFAVDESSQLSIEKAQIIAVENSKQLQIDDYNIKSGESVLRDAKDAVGKWRAYSTLIEVLNNEIRDQVAPLEAESNIEVERKVKLKDINNIKLDTYKQITDFLLLQKQLEKENQMLSILQKKYDISNSQFSIGKITESDFYDIQYNLENKKVDIENLNRDINSKEINIKSLLNMPFDDTVLIFSDELKAVEIGTIDISALVLNAIANDGSIYKSIQDVKYKDMILSLTEEHYKEGESTYDTNRVALESAKLSLENLEARLETNIRNKYNDLLNAKDSVDLADKYLLLQEKKLKNALIKFDKGILSKSNVLQQQELNIDAQYQKFAAIHAFNIIKAEFDNMTQN